MIDYSSISHYVVNALIFGLCCYAIFRAFRRAREIKQDASREAILAQVSSEAKTAAFICRAGIVLAVISLVVSIAFLPGVVMDRATSPDTVVKNNMVEKRVDGGVVHEGSEEDKTIRIQNGTSSIVLLAPDGDNPVYRALAYVLGIAMAWEGARFFGAIAKTGRPFDPSRARELLWIARLAFLAAFSKFVTGMAIQAFVLPAIGYSGSSSVGSIVDITALGVFVVAYIFACIFQYGCQLQDQDDRLL